MLARRLEPLAETHLPAVEELLSDDGVLRFTRVPEPVPPNFAKTWYSGVAKRCGYVREGVLRSVYFKQGRRNDFEIWSRLPTDP